MELRELILILVSRKNLFAGVFLGCVVASLLVFQFQPKRYEASLLLNVTRAGSQATADYAYDHFYRLQADERFADTVVRWLSAPSILSEISGQGGSFGEIVPTISAKRLSSQVIDVRYRSNDPGKLAGMDAAIVRALNREAEKLNELPAEKHWFLVVGDDPAVSDARMPFGTVFGGGLVTGLFLGFLFSLFSWYMVGKKPVS